MNERKHNSKYKKFNLIQEKVEKYKEINSLFSFYYFNFIKINAKTIFSLYLTLLLIVISTTTHTHMYISCLCVCQFDILWFLRL